MATINLYSKTECNAVIPKGNENNATYSDCVADVQSQGFYAYDAGWQMPAPSTVAFYSASVSLVVIAVVLVLRFMRERPPAA